MYIKIFPQHLTAEVAHWLAHSIWNMQVMGSISRAKKYKLEQGVFYAFD
jgi:hypothetical protein